MNSWTELIDKIVVETPVAVNLPNAEWVQLGFKDEKGEWTPRALAVLKTIPQGASTYAHAQKPSSFPLIWFF